MVYKLLFLVNFWRKAIAALWRRCGLCVPIHRQIFISCGTFFWSSFKFNLRGSTRIGTTSAYSNLFCVQYRCIGIRNKYVNFTFKFARTQFKIIFLSKKWTFYFSAHRSKPFFKPQSSFPSRFTWIIAEGIAFLGAVARFTSQRITSALHHHITQ